MDPQVQAVLDELEALGPLADDNAPETLWLANFRYRTALLRTFSGAPAPLLMVSHYIVSTPAGPLPVRLYRPGRGRLPLLVHVHGGGGLAGALDDYDPALRALALATGWLVAAPDYRLAPERRFPAQIVDVAAALGGLATASEEIGALADRTVISGDSLGGTMAFSVLGMTQSHSGPPLAGAVLIYPNTDLRSVAAYPSRRTEDGRIITEAGLERQIQLYVRDAHRSDPLVSPIVTPDLSGRPPTLLVTCEHDPLRDEGEALATALAFAGVSVEHIRMAGQCHGLLQMGGRVDAAARLFELIANWLARVGGDEGRALKPAF